MEKEINMKQEENKLVIEQSINYKLTLDTEGYTLDHEPSVGTDLVGLIICKRIHENMVADIEKVKKNGLPPEFKNKFNNRLKDLRKSIHTINVSINHLIKFAAKESLK